MADPRTHAVGKLAVIYGDGVVEHSFSVGLLLGEDPFNGADMLSYADTLAGLLRAVLSPTFTITRWKSFDTNLVEALSLPLSADAPGTHGTDSGFPPYKSLTFAVTGMTKTPTALNRIQQTRAFVFVLNTLAVPAGRKKFTAAEAGTEWLDLIEHLDTNAHYWGDVQGRKAAARSSITIQFNAFEQQQIGS